MREITYGSYHIRLAPSYVQDNTQENREAEYQLDHEHEPGLIRVRVYSRFRNATGRQLWISFIENVEDTRGMRKIYITHRKDSSMQ